MLLLRLWWTTLLLRPRMMVLDLLEVAHHSSVERNLRGVKNNPRGGFLWDYSCIVAANKYSIAEAVR
jgi:hypothetical protein